MARVQSLQDSDDVGSFSNPTFTDIDDDGDLDLFIGERKGKTLFFRNTAAAPLAPVSSTTPNGTYAIGDVINLTIGFSETVRVDTSSGTPTLQLETGSNDRYATYASGSGSNTLTFQYTVQAGDSTTDLDQFSSTALALNGGSITDAVGNQPSSPLLLQVKPAHFPPIPISSSRPHSPPLLKLTPPPRTAPTASEM